jgi:hypothetical protein
MTIFEPVGCLPISSYKAGPAKRASLARSHLAFGPGSQHEAAVVSGLFWNPLSLYLRDMRGHYFVSGATANVLNSKVFRTFGRQPLPRGGVCGRSDESTCLRSVTRA